MRGLQRCFHFRLRAFAGLARGRVVRALLGESAINEKKLLHGNPLVLLGVDVALREEGVRFKPCREKRQKWKRVIRVALETNTLTSGDASKLAGGSRMCTCVSLLL